MSGLPEIRKPAREASPFFLLHIAGVERITKALMEGKPFSAESLSDLEQLSRRSSAFISALDARILAQKEAQKQ